MYIFYVFSYIITYLPVLVGFFSGFDFTIRNSKFSLPKLMLAVSLSKMCFPRALHTYYCNVSVQIFLWPNTEKKKSLKSNELVFSVSLVGRDQISDTHVCPSRVGYVGHYIYTNHITSLLILCTHSSVHTCPQADSDVFLFFSSLPLGFWRTRPLKKLITPITHGHYYELGDPLENQKKKTKLNLKRRVM